MLIQRSAKAQAVIDERRRVKRERCLRVLEIRESGATWVEVGRQFGISRERARQLGLAGIRYRASS